MTDLFNTPYAHIYESLQEVRELFHREGKISDSNAKLDETVKLIAVHFAAYKGLLDQAVIDALSAQETFTVKTLDCAFISVAKGKPFLTEDGTSIFGAAPTIAFNESDRAVAFELFNAVGQAFRVQTANEKPLDFLNEAFGHHVRDNFRSHVEDAQYMTPPEVIEFMISMASDLVALPSEKNNQKFVMLDPSCGVGSFVAAWRKEYEKKNNGEKNSRHLIAIGQDKVERMARLSAINLIFSENSRDKVFVGNSLLDGSPLDPLNDTVDLILTNPPFGAKFPRSMIASKATKSTPFFAKAALGQKTIDSEVLFVDRYLALLRPGGYCLVVVPDGIISAKGTAAILRQHLVRSADIIAVIELPPTAFAQAGTRTKTAVLVFKKKDNKDDKSSPVFLAEAQDLGFDVSKRKGVPIKKEQGSNQLPEILEIFRSGSSKSKRGLATWVDADFAQLDAWTPRQFLVKDKNVAEKNGTQSATQKLSELVQPQFRRKVKPYVDESYFISVLHVIGEGLLDVSGMKNYRPITPGLPVEPGEVIISRLNPRIPRVLVVPDLGAPTLCSSEFEILRPNGGVSPFAIAYLLMTPRVQEQIQALTAGTSASHSRVKSDRLYEIVLAWPQGKQKEAFDSAIADYRKASERLIQSMMAISNLREESPY